MKSSHHTVDNAESVLLNYLSCEQRDWFGAPVPSHRSANWEFVAILRGKAAPTISEVQLRMQPPTLWVFAPDTHRGWTSKGPDGNMVATFRFSLVDPVLESLVGVGGWISAFLTCEEISEVHKLARELWPHYWLPTAVSDIHARRALAMLTLMALKQRPEYNRPATPNDDLLIMEAAKRRIGAP